MFPFQLTDKCKKALTRVFRICDTDCDGLLSDQELANFQRKCFGMDLEAGTLESLKAVVHKNCSEGEVLSLVTTGYTRHCLWFWMADFLTFCYSPRHWSQRADGERFPDATRVVHSKGSTRNHVDDTEKVWL